MIPAADWTALLQRVVSAPNPADGLRTVLDHCAQTCNASHVLLAMVNTDSGELEIRGGVGDAWERVGRERPMTIDVQPQEGIAGWVAATGTSFLTAFSDQAPEFRALFDSTESELAVPVRDRFNRVRAVLNIESDHQYAFTEEHHQWVQAYASLVGMVIEREDAENNQEALIHVGSALDTITGEDSLLEQVIHVAESILRLHSCSIFMVDESGESAVLRATIGTLRDQVGSLRYRMGEGFTGWVCLHGQPILLDDPQLDPRWRGKYVEIPSEQISSFLAVPIILRGTILGVIRVLRRRLDNPFLDNRFTIQDQRVLQAIAEQVATGLENIRNIERIVRSERMIAWGELSAKSSHMIGNRVFALKGDVNELAFLLKDSPLSQASLEEVQRSMAANVLRIEEILQDFRDFVTATQIERTATDLSALVEETAAEVFPKRTENRLELRVPPSVVVDIDPRRLRRAVSELIENSLHYISDGTLRIALEEDEYEVRLSISDTGPGIEAAKKAMIWQPFYSGRVKGMGLGLSIVKGIVDAHGGSVTEVGQAGQGAEFLIRLPRSGGVTTPLAGPKITGTPAAVATIATLNRE